MNSPCDVAWLFGGHSPQNIPSGYSAIREQDLILAIDSGLDFVHARSWKPDLIIGDFDSLSDLSLLKRYDKVEQISHNPAKNETDTELAVLWCIKRGIKEMIICNDMQGRLDHSQALIQNLLLAHEHGIKARIETKCELLFFLSEETPIPYPPGNLLSLIPMSDLVILNKSEGLRYPLDGLHIKRSSSRGISNEIETRGARIWKSSGEILAIVTILSLTENCALI
ncbi:MAG: thiamine diphosphokinase [Candidatus Cloacimonetes bacterium]|nr:thiamine diphosphokinase [Candidatus Cloacimonadota bacterium]